MSRAPYFAIGIFLMFTGACAGKDPGDTDDRNTDDTGAYPDAGEKCAENDLTYQENVSGCQPTVGDYLPRENGSADDEWEACISDDNTYHQVEESVSSISRVEVYEAIGELLWENDAISAEDFIDARVLFEEEQGLGSRVARRWDPHYKGPMEGSCEDKGVPEAYPDYCVGPATLQPIIVDAFASGAGGEEMLVNAAKIEAALQWFFYVSSIKEATTCEDTPKDCDSCWAYYTGGTPRETPIGLAADIDDLAPATHDRAYDGVLAVRCWRDLDQEMPATDPAMQTRAISQLDTALLRGMSILVRQRFLALECSSGDHRAATLEALRILVPLLSRGTRERDPAAAGLILGEVGKEASVIDADAAIAALDDVYSCP
ncbi:MAG: hypothetical protein GY854_31705 [Deltaproteobacteria bacterium]|nr:hypothetical protein [Deltaproteobacteria bacterium]